MALSISSFFNSMALALVVAWVCLLYTVPLACIRHRHFPNTWRHWAGVSFVAPPICLSHGTPCHTCPHLPIGTIKECISLYADDTLVYLADPCESLKALLVEIDTIGDYSCFRVNCDISTLFFLDQMAVPVVHPDSRLLVVTSFR